MTILYELFCGSKGHQGKICGITMASIMYKLELKIEGKKHQIDKHYVEVCPKFKTNQKVSGVVHALDPSIMVRHEFLLSILLEYTQLAKFIVCNYMKLDCLCTNDFSGL